MNFNNFDSGINIEHPEEGFKKAKDAVERFELENLSTPEIALVGLVGLVLMFGGYRIKKIAFFLLWFVLGFYITTLALPNFESVLPDSFRPDLVYAIGPILGGLLLAMLGFSIEKLCVSGACFALVMLITAQYFGTGMETMMAGGIIGVVAAGAATMLMKPAAIVATSLAGAYTLTMVLIALVPGFDANAMFFPSLIGFTVIGSTVQFLTTKGMG